MSRETANMHLVDDGLRRGPIERRVALPVVSARINHNALHRLSSIVVLPARGISTVVGWKYHAKSIRVEEDFGWIEARSRLWVETAPHSVTINLARLEARHEHVPIVISKVCGRVDSNHTRGTCVIHTVKK